MNSRNTLACYILEKIKKRHGKTINLNYNLQSGMII